MNFTSSASQCLPRPLTWVAVFSIALMYSRLFASTYTVVYTGGSGGATKDGTAILTVATGAASDAAGNLSLAPTNTANTITYDVTAPTSLTLAQASTQRDPTSGTIRFTVTGNEDLSAGSITAGDVVVTNGTVTGATTCVGPVCTITVTAATDGIVSIAPSASVRIAHVTSSGPPAAGLFTRNEAGSTCAQLSATNDTDTGGMQADYGVPDTDEDQDGYGAYSGDCNDADGTIRPNAPEVATTP